MRAAFLLRPASIRDAMLIGDFHTPNPESIAAIEEVREMCSHPKTAKAIKLLKNAGKPCMKQITPTQPICKTAI